MKNALLLFLTNWRQPKQQYLPAFDTQIHHRWFWQGTLMLVMLSSSTISVLADVNSLGMTIGKSTLAQVKKQSPMLVEAGVNKYSKGPMLKGLNPKWNIKGLKKTVLIFDDKNTLAVINMTMDKQQFKRVLGFLQSKYTLVNKKVPFVGYRSALLIAQKSKVLIEIPSPHMAFDMDLVYSTFAFDKAYKQISSDERRRKNNLDKSQF